MSVFARVREFLAGNSDSVISNAGSELPPAVVMAEALGLTLSALPPSRDKAIQVPAVARGRNLIVGAIAPLPLVALDASGPIKRQPAFLFRSNTIENPHDRMLNTVDDLIFHGMSLWGVERGSKANGAAHGPILDAVRVPYSRWHVRDGRIEVQKSETGGFEPVQADDVVLFNGPTGGLLHDASDTLRAAEAIERAYVDRARNPLPLVVIQHTPNSGAADQLTEKEAKDLVAKWRESRRSPDGAVGYLPPSLTMQTPGAEAESLLESARNAVRIDVANHINLPVALLDGGVHEESLTYRNAQGEVSRFHSDIQLWVESIQHRLSEDDVVPRGQRVRFDLARFDTPAPASTGVPTED